MRIDMVKEKRLKERHRYFYSRVYDENTHHQAGRLVDITTVGIRLISDNFIETDTDFQLRMVLPKGIEGKKSIRFDARSIWCKKTTHTELYDAGFKLTNISPENLEIIEQLIQNY